MLIRYLLFFITLPLFAETGPVIKVTTPTENRDDFEHKFKGCPENSECDQVMGLQLQRWNELVSKLQKENMSSEKKSQLLELFRSKYGIPSELYTYVKSQKGYRPLYFNSSCKKHNPKEEEKRILKGMAFTKSIDSKKATVWRDQAQIEVPIEDGLYLPQPVVVYYPSSTLKYYLPLNDQPLFIKDKSLYVLREAEGFFYMLKVTPAGQWSIENVDMTRLSNWEEKKQEVKCPLDKTPLAPSVFEVEFCKSIWDEDAKSTVTVKMHSGCVI